MTHLTRLLLAVLLAVLLISCSLFTPTETPAAPSPAPVLPTLTQTPAATEPPLITVTPPPVATETVLPTVPSPPAVTETAFPTATPDPAKYSDTLSATGPWLLISTSTGLWAANEDGSGLTHLTSTQVVSPGDPRSAISPDGRSVAFVTSDPDHVHHLALNLLTLPGSKITTITPLTNANSEPGPDISIRDDRTEAVSAILYQNPVAWSPDGKTLAFIGVQDGPSADLYTYVLATGKITRLSDGPSQAYDPIWSPDGRYILHFGVRTFGTGAGYDMAGVWAASGDKPGIVTLVTGGGSGQEFYGWVDDHRFLISDWTPACGKKNLRLQDISTAKAVTIEPGCFSGAGASTATGLILLGGYGDSPVKGLQSVNAATLARTQLSPADVADIRYLPDGADFLVKGMDSAQIISNTGLLMAESPKSNCTYDLEVASYGALYAWACSPGPDYGVYFNGMGVPGRLIFDQAASFPTWSPKNTLIFFSSGTLYRALFFDYKPEPMSRIDGDILGVAWAVP